MWRPSGSTMKHCLAGRRLRRAEGAGGIAIGRDRHNPALSCKKRRRPFRGAFVFLVRGSVGPTGESMPAPSSASHLRCSSAHCADSPSAATVVVNFSHCGRSGAWTILFSDPLCVHWRRGCDHECYASRRRVLSRHRRCGGCYASEIFRLLVWLTRRSNLGTKKTASLRTIRYYPLRGSLPTESRTAAAK